jgi:hypothetical protein
MNNFKISHQLKIFFMLWTIFGAITLLLMTGCKVTQIHNVKNEYKNNDGKMESEFKTKLISVDADDQEIVTQQEKILMLDEKLEKSMAEFDNMFAVKIREIEAEKDKLINEMSDGRQSSSALVEDTSNSDSQPKSASNSSEGNEGGSGKQSAPGKNYGKILGKNNNYIDQSTSSQSSLPGEGKNISIPEDIPSGESDDIIARQIREAAISEKNPKLKEKLWEEYRKYKGAQ